MHESPDNHGGSQPPSAYLADVLSDQQQPFLPQLDMDQLATLPAYVPVPEFSPGAIGSLLGDWTSGLDDRLPPVPQQPQFLPWLDHVDDENTIINLLVPEDSLPSPQLSEVTSTSVSLASPDLPFSNGDRGHELDHILSPSGLASTESQPTNVSAQPSSLSLSKESGGSLPQPSSVESYARSECSPPPAAPTHLAKPQPQQETKPVQRNQPQPAPPVSSFFQSTEHACMATSKSHTID
jgi:hypothetical protein